MNVILKLNPSVFIKTAKKPEDTDEGENFHAGHVSSLKRQKSWDC